jgi:hypothetical protein
MKAGVFGPDFDLREEIAEESNLEASAKQKLKNEMTEDACNRMIGLMLSKPGY